MNDIFQGKYRVKSHRWSEWDYSACGFYFITIVTQDRKLVLGDVVGGEMVLSEFGKIVESEWFKSFDIRDELFLHAFVIMPNHIHAIIELNNDNPHGHADTHGRADQQAQLHRLPKSISSFIAGFKSVVNSKIDDFIDANDMNTPKYNRNNHFFQPNYHDHIVRNENEFRRIENYIHQNPVEWERDKLNDVETHGRASVQEDCESYNEEKWMV